MTAACQRHDFIGAHGQFARLMGYTETAGPSFNRFGLDDVPTAALDLHKFDPGLSGQNAHTLPDVLRDSHLTFSGYAHDC